ncbi:MAG: FeoC-like transcriptional regulator [Anaerolineales bacterium]
MSKSKLGQVLESFENSPGGKSLLALARDLNLSQGQTKNLVDYWVRKGRIRAVAQQPDCQTCGTKKACPFIFEMPRYYEIADD